VTLYAVHTIRSTRQSVFTFVDLQTRWLDGFIPNET